MFLRVLGRQCLILSRFRDGYGKVRQPRLASFRSRESLEETWREPGADPSYRGEELALRRTPPALGR